MLEVVSGPEQVSPNGRVQLVQVAFSGDSRDERVQDAAGALRERAAPLFAGTGLVAGLTGTRRSSSTERTRSRAAS